MQQAVTKGRLFRRFSAVTIIAVYLLIAVGGIVRSTGSGMGCPDWPKCFGSWVPPTEAAQLPLNYKDIYAQQRAEKNIKFVGYLRSFGFDELAAEIENDPSILIEEDFNAAKTWTEYVNRLIGALIGVLIFATFVSSISYWKEDKTVTVLSFLAFVLVGLEGWIGAFVVSTNLMQWIITVHMLLALAIVCLLIYVYYRSRKQIESKLDIPKKAFWLGIVCLVLTLIQVVLGTQVREAIDVFAESAVARAEWIEQIGATFLIHRSYSLLLMGLHMYLFWVLYKSSAYQHFKGLMMLLVGVVAFEIVTGAIMAYFAIPAVFQPIHLLFGSLIIGIQYYLVLLIRRKGRGTLVKV